jgi:hypothetical protein
MRVAIATAILGAVLVASPSSQTSGPRPSDSLERAFAPNGKVRMDLSAGAYAISGSKDNRIRIEWSVRDADQLHRVHARADVRGSEATIATDGPSNNQLHFNIQVPGRSDLYVRMTAGEIRIEDVRGNKDVELHAGDARIDVGRAEDYNRVDASVWAGDLHAAPFNVIKGGLFRSFDWSGKGPYRLHAKLKAGDLRLYAKGARLGV